MNAVDFQDHAVLLLAFESHEAPLESAMSAAVDLAKQCGGELIRPPNFSTGDLDRGKGADPNDAGGAWKRAFFEATCVQSRLLALGLMVDTFETACTWQGFDALKADITATATDALLRVCGHGRITCRFTHAYPDGPAPYFTFFAPFRRGSELSQWAEVKFAVSEAISRNGATITHHHAVGLVEHVRAERRFGQPRQERAGQSER